MKTSSGQKKNIRNRRKLGENQYLSLKKSEKLWLRKQEQNAYKTHNNNGILELKNMIAEIKH